jgi:hypothetical protein
MSGLDGASLYTEDADAIYVVAGAGRVELRCYYKNESGLCVLTPVEARRLARALLVGAEAVDARRVDDWGTDVLR